MTNTSGEKQQGTAVKVAIIGGCFTVVAAIISAIAAISSGAWVLYEEPTPSSIVPLSNAPAITNSPPTSFSTPYPSETTTSTNLPPTQIPTSTSIIINNPAPHQDTPAGTVLAPGDIWYQGGMEMRIKNPSFVPGCNGIFGFEITLTNNTGGELVTNISGLDFAITDNAGNIYPDTWFDKGAASQNCYYGGELKDLSIIAMKAGERFDLAIRVLGNSPTQATQMIITVYKASRIENAIWAITIPK